MKYSERTTDPVHAVEAASLYARQHGITLTIEHVGSHLQTPTCTLTDLHGRRAEGRGKGLGDQSLASAIFEAFEHYYYSTENLDQKARPIAIDTDYKMLLRGSSPDFDLLFEQRDVRLSSLSFNEILAEENFLQFPAVFTNPNYIANEPEESETINKFRLKRYSSNSGTASGMNKPDAILHGLLESIERDAIGIALLQSVISRSGSPVREIDVSTLPHETTVMYDLACLESGGTIRLWDITTDTKVPVILCALSLEKGSAFCFFGSGASLSVKYAAERAMLEAVQGYHVQFGYNVRFQLPMKIFTKKMSLYQRCHLDDGYFSYRWGYVPVDFNELESLLDQDIEASSESQIQLITNHLDSMDIRVFYRVIHDSAIFVSQVLIPKLERFYLVSHGIPVAPSEGGKRFLNPTTR